MFKLLSCYTSFRISHEYRELSKNALKNKKKREKQREKKQTEGASGTGGSWADATLQNAVFDNAGHEGPKAI